MLTDARVKAAKPKERAFKLTDGGGLVVFVTPTGSKLRRMFPTLGQLPIREITPPMVLGVLRAIEARPAPETARRGRQRMSAIFVYAIADRTLSVRVPQCPPRSPPDVRKRDRILAQPGRLSWPPRSTWLAGDVLISDE